MIYDSFTTEVCMASFKKIKDEWQAQVAIKGPREARNFSTKAEATSWAAECETEIRKQYETGVDLSKTAGDAFDRYGTDVTSQKARSKIGAKPVRICWRPTDQRPGNQDNPPP